MPKVAIYDMSGAQVGEMQLSDSIFGIEVSEPAMHQVVVAQLANRRQGTKSAKTRSEVSGGGRKPWRQKGTGRARHGSTRAPQWRHGGVVFAPKPRSFRQQVNKKVRRLAMKSAFSVKAAENNIIVLDKLELDEIKTRRFAQILSALQVQGKALVVLPAPDDTVYFSARNLPGVQTTLVNTLNVYDIMNNAKFIVTKEAVDQIEEVYAMKSPYDVVIKPVLTEKSFDNMADRKYTFIVERGANKTQIKQAVEEIFGVQVEKINTALREGKVKRRGRFVGKTPATKRAIVKLTQDSKAIEFFEGMA